MQGVTPPKKKANVKKKKNRNKKIEKKEGKNIKIKKINQNEVYELVKTGEFLRSNSPILNFSEICTPHKKIQDTPLIITNKGAQSIVVVHS